METLSRCFPPSIRRTLDGLPKSLDETYERILAEIDEEKQVYANRLLQCLATSIRPLRVEELAELFAVLPNAESAPDFEISWRPEDPEAFILSACSTLVTIVDTGDGTLVQFSHFSVKEYLTSDRIANSTRVFHFQVLPKPAHTLLARACLSVLLQLDYSIDKIKIKNFPLASYAAHYWMDHACFEDVSSNVSDGMDLLFDKDKPHLAASLWVYNRDLRHYLYDYDITAHPERPDAVPLYFAALFGLRDLVERLLDAHPQDLNAEGGACGTPLCAALYEKHLDIALFLLKHGADGETSYVDRQTGLYVASSSGYVEIVRTLIDRGADLNAECKEVDDSEWGGDGYLSWTPLHVALSNERLEVAKLLLGYGTDVNYPDSLCRSPLQSASRYSHEGLVRLLLDHGANPSASDAMGETALHEASSAGEPGVVRLLLHHGLDVNARSGHGRNSWHGHGQDLHYLSWEPMDSEGWTPLHYAVFWGCIEVAQVLVDHGADMNPPDHGHWTPLHLAAFQGRLQVVDTLLRCGANPHARTTEGHTPFEVVKKCPSSESSRHHPQIMQLLSDHTGESGYDP